jgi:hypothetical protein
LMCAVQQNEFGREPGCGGGLANSSKMQQFYEIFFL